MGEASRYKTSRGFKCTCEVGLVFFSVPHEKLPWKNAAALVGAPVMNTRNRPESNLE